MLDYSANMDDAATKLEILNSDSSPTCSASVCTVELFTKTSYSKLFYYWSFSLFQTHPK